MYFPATHPVHTLAVPEASFQYPGEQAETSLLVASVQVVTPLVGSTLATGVHAVQHAVASSATLISHGAPAQAPVAPTVANSPVAPPAAWHSVSVTAPPAEPSVF